MSKPSVQVDRDIAAQAAQTLGTTTLRETIDRSLHEVVDAAQRVEMFELLAEPHRFEFGAAEQAWGGDH